MSAFPSLPLFTDAFIADTGHLSAQETGAYLMLMMVAWRSPECRLPDADDKLARWARVDRRTWLRIKPIVMEFWTFADGFWTQKRLSKERDVVSKRAEAARENGRHGGRPKSLENNDMANPAGSARVSGSKAPNPSPNPIHEEPTVLPDRGAAPAAKRERKVKPHLCPDGFSPKDRHYSAIEARGYSRDLADREAVRMHRWSNSEGKAACRKSDWDLAFDNWIERAMDALDNRPPPRGSPGSNSTGNVTTGGFATLNRSIRETYRNGQSDRAPEFDLEPHAGGSPVVQLRRAYG